MSVLLTFVLGYVGIVFESLHKINKAAVALLTGIVCWIFIAVGLPATLGFSEKLMAHLAGTASILFFLMGAMVIVELIDAHDGFDVITSRITAKSNVALLWIIGIVTFFLSSILDNLTTTIVMVTLVAKLLSDKDMRALFVGIVVIAANAGGAWTPIGDVTTTMLWIGGQISSLGIMSWMAIPSMVCILVPMAIVSFQIGGKVKNNTVKKKTNPTFEKNLVLISGVAAIVSVPVFKALTNLPPFMGMLLGLSCMWFLTEIIHKHKEPEVRHAHSIAQALQRIDMTTILFFLGILLSVSALETVGILTQMATWLIHSVGNITVVVFLIGLLSAVIDNVPLVAATMGMFSLNSYPIDHHLWLFLAYCAGTGGSILIIGSAAGVAAMGMAKIDFFWYLKKIGWLALIGYVAGAVAYVGLGKLF